MPFRIAAAILAGVLACGLPLWPIPYSQVSMPGNPPPVLWLALGSGAGLLAGYLLRTGWRTPILAVTAGFLLAAVGRITVETARDPTSHNLWPFEVVIVGFFGILAAVIGVSLARGIQRVSSRA